MNANSVLDNWINDFVYMQQYVDWGILTYTFHPFVIGRGHRMLVLEKLLRARATAARSSAPWRTPPTLTTYGSPFTPRPDDEDIHQQRRPEARVSGRRLHRPLAKAGHAAAAACSHGQLAALVPMGAAARAPLPRRAPGPARPRQVGDARPESDFLAGAAGR